MCSVGAYPVSVLGPVALTVSVVMSSAIFIAGTVFVSSRTAPLGSESQAAACKHQYDSSCCCCHYSSDLHYFQSPSFIHFTNNTNGMEESFQTGKNNLKDLRAGLRDENYLGSFTRNREPPATQLSTSTVPPHSARIFLTRASPRPFPSMLRFCSP